MWRARSNLHSRRSNFRKILSALLLLDPCLLIRHDDGVVRSQEYRNSERREAKVQEASEHSCTAIVFEETKLSMLSNLRSRFQNG